MFGSAKAGRKTSREQQAPLRMPPACQRLPSAHDLGSEIDDRLVIGLELVSGQPDADLIQQPSMSVDMLAQAGLENAEPIAAVELGLVQGDVGILEQCIGRRDPCAAETGANADRGLEHDPVRIERSPGLLDDSGGSSPKIVFVAHPMEHDRELVAAQARHEIGRPDGFREPTTRFLQQLVPNRVPVRVVHSFEAVDVDDADRQSLARPPGTGLIDVRLERPTIGQACEDILVRQQSKPFLGLSLARDVLNDADEALRSAGRVDLREHPHPAGVSRR